MAMLLAGPRGGMNESSRLTKSDGICDVWASNLEQEFRNIRQMVEKYSWVAMDTEFPGIVARPLGDFRSTTDYQYQLLRCNVGLLKLIQVGITFMDPEGNLPPDCSTWQFNFKFSLQEDMYAADSIELLQQSGIDFRRLNVDGIDFMDFSELLITSGLVLMDEVTWLSFHSGYDFGYLLKILTGESLPEDESEFFELLKLFFPNTYDVKFLMKSCKNLKGGLQEVADNLEVKRVGPQHQAGSDSLLTGVTFFKMKQMFFEDQIDQGRFSGHLYGLGAGNVGMDSAAAPIEDVGPGGEIKQGTGKIVNAPDHLETIGLIEGGVKNDSAAIGDKDSALEDGGGSKTADDEGTSAS